MNSDTDKLERIADSLQNLGLDNELEQRVLRYCEIVQSSSMVHKMTTPLLKETSSLDELANLQSEQLLPTIKLSKLGINLEATKYDEFVQFLVGAFEMEFYQSDEIILE